MIVGDGLVFGAIVSSGRITSFPTSVACATVLDVRDTWAKQNEVVVSVTGQTRFFSGAMVYDEGRFVFSGTTATALVVQQYNLTGQGSEATTSAYVTEVLSIKDRLLDTSISSQQSGTGGGEPTAPTTTYYWS